jgi:hypothetical protein
MKALRRLEKIVRAQYRSAKMPHEQALQGS